MELRDSPLAANLVRGASLQAIDATCMGEKRLCVIREFRDFAIKGTVIDIATGLVVGAASGAIVAVPAGAVSMPPTIRAARPARGCTRRLDPSVVPDNPNSVPLLPAGLAAAAAAGLHNIGLFTNAVVVFAIVVAFGLYLALKGINATGIRRQRHLPHIHRFPPQTSSSKGTPLDRTP